MKTVLNMHGVEHGLKNACSMVLVRLYKLMDDKEVTNLYNTHFVYMMFCEIFKISAMRLLFD
jgi:hypothetical protein